MLNGESSNSEGTASGAEQVGCCALCFGTVVTNRIVFSQNGMVLCFCVYSSHRDHMANGNAS